jgi:hypothetical protein
MSQIPWVVNISARDPQGNPIEVKFFTSPLEDGGYVINFVTEEDKKRNDGKCWGTIIYPSFAQERE